MWLLLVEDELSLSRSVRRGLEEEGYRVDVALDGLRGLDLALINDYDTIIVDWRLPLLQGDALVRRLREEGRMVPVLMLTALGNISDRIAGLDAGADDYLTKPFDFEELLARLRALVRRSRQGDDPKVLQAGPLTIDRAQREVTLAGSRLDLRPKEYAVLELLLRYRKRVLTRTMLVERVWNAAYYVSDNLLDVTVSRLRRQLREVDPSETVHIATVRGAGYRLLVSGEVDA